MISDLEVRVLMEEHHRRSEEAALAARVRGRRRAERRRRHALRFAGERSTTRRRLRVAVAGRLRRWADRLEPPTEPRKTAPAG